MDVHRDHGPPEDEDLEGSRQREEDRLGDHEDRVDESVVREKRPDLVAAAQPFLAAAAMAPASQARARPAPAAKQTACNLSICFGTL